MLLSRKNSSEQGQYYFWIGFALCCVFVFTKIHFKDIAKIAEPLVIILGFYGIYRYGNEYRVSPVMWLFLASILIPLISWYFAYQSYPEWVDDYPKLDKLARLFVFIPLAWFLKNNPRHVFIFWGLAALSVLLSPWLSGDGWQEIQQGFQGVRIDFGIRNAQHTSLFFGFTLIGLVCFSSQLWHWSKIVFVFILTGIAMCLFTLYASQTRAAWLAMLITVSAVFFLLINRHEVRQWLKHHKMIATFCIIIACLISFLSYSIVWPKLEIRMQHESATVTTLLNGDFDKIPYSSIGIRLNTWKAALENIKKRPFIGWGNNGQSIAVRKTPWLPEWVRNSFGHLHNSYLALLTNYGLLGFSFYIFLCGYIFASIFNAVKDGFLTPEIGYFTFTTAIFWGTINLFESYLFFWTGVFCIQTLFAGFLALIWHAQLKQKETL